MQTEAKNLSGIVKVGYDTATSVLRVTLQSGATYSYLGVPAELYMQLLNSFSLGTFVNSRIRGRYPCKKGR